MANDKVRNIKTTIAQADYPKRNILQSNGEQHLVFSISGKDRGAILSSGNVGRIFKY